MSTFAFDSISSSRRVPGSQMEFSNVRALTGLPAAVQKVLLVGQKLATGTVAALTPKRITQVAEGAAFFGRGSVLAAMVARAIAVNSSTELWAIGLDDNGAGTAATWTVTLTGPATSAGTLAYLIAGQKVPVAVASGDTATIAATALAAAVNALPDLPVTATSAAGVVTLTFRHKGTAGNDLDIRLNYYEGEVTPAGLTSVVAAGVAGATNPDLTAAFAAIGDVQYQTIALGFNDAANLTVADTEMLSRWGPGRQIDGRVFAGLSGSFSTCSTFGATRNGIFTTIVGAYKMPSPPWEVAAGFAGVAAFNLQIDPARPLTDLVVSGLLPPKPGERFIDSERNILLSNAISTFRVTAGGEVAIERLISTYRVNSLGFPDVSWLDVTTTATLSYYRFSYRARMAAKFPRAKLTNDTIRSIRAETIALARDWGDAGLMEDVDGFIAGLVLERDSTNVNQLNTLMIPNVVNGLLQLAARIEFIL
ncbi:phage tail sheath subtilisin-like domain-containing protein [Sphingomonas sp. AR_OL41]|uniref:phage tail sheath subtilisin-like domain-containing protein n=1 Tax=Sphingomonas sp. AR_OL41 TaxID=3042729 RepID=UPI002480C7E0|nr:phage tail sheath subtilisin-like domain-containing protein [Sphingomonas sp. AR_OL41]MDH7971784.1 phage tail sheath subtilisin-like domain-containing protein [Sphingomonas sp. AR_OL41]